MWIQGLSDHPREVIEAALAHVVQNLVEAAYARSDLFERRRVLMNDWARYLARGPGRIRSPWSKESQGMGCPHQVWQGDLARGRPGRESGSKPCGKAQTMARNGHPKARREALFAADEFFATRISNPHTRLAFTLVLRRLRPFKRQLEITLS